MTLSAAILCLALNIYYEARGESLTGQRAVAHVVVNRVNSSGYPDTVCSVVYQDDQFSWTDMPNKPKPRGEQWTQARQLARAVLTGTSVDPTKGATHFHAVHIKPKWTYKLRKTAVIGRHAFYKLPPYRGNI